MTQIIMLVPVGSGVGLTSISLGIVHAFEQKGYPVTFFKPIQQGPSDNSTELVQVGSPVETIPCLPRDEVEALLANDQMPLVLDKLLNAVDSKEDNNQVIILEGLINTATLTYGIRINREIAAALGAQIILVASAEGHDLEALKNRIEIAIDSYQKSHQVRVTGCIVNKVGGSNAEDKISRMEIQLDEAEQKKYCSEIEQMPIFQDHHIKLVGTIPWSPELAAPRVKDLCRYLGAQIVQSGDIEHRRIRKIALCTRLVNNLIPYLKPSTLLITAGDRTDILVAASLAVMNGTKIGGVLFTGGYPLSPNIKQICSQAFQAGLPVLSVDGDTWETARHIQAYPHDLPADDLQRINRVRNFVASYLDSGWIKLLAQEVKELVLSPTAFKHMLTKKACQANKRIILPEGNEPRTLKAAAICAKKGIARCVLLGNKEEIQLLAKQNGIHIDHPNLEIWDPKDYAEDLVEPLVKLRKHKGISEILARDLLTDNIMVGTMLLYQGKVDGLVSGAIHTTAHTIRPALQIIKTAPGSSLISSVFFMLLPDRVLVYGDCAINPDPSAEQLAEIAIQSSQSAKTFGLNPKTAMISYSTGSSGTGVEVEKVKKATQLAQAKAPEFTLDGPLQYDAAIMPDVAKSKAPNSPVAGQANVFIFPDLNTGNTTYKAVQRSADALSIGPMLQGLNKPVNDLSRGALVDDIVYTIALTAIQATH